MATKASTNARMQAAQMAKQKAKESQDRTLGKSYIKSKHKKLSPESGDVTTLTVIPYRVREKSHPQDIPVGTIWYRRPIKIHRNVGAGDDARPMPCPKNWGKHTACAMCSDANSAWEQYRAAQGQQEKDQAKEAAKSVQAQQRDLLLVYHHEKDEVVYMDGPYGGGSLRGFGALLDARLINPPSEDCAAFYLDGPLAKEDKIPGEGYALRASWLGNKSGGGQREWIQPVSIDFIPRKQAGAVPDWAWKESVDLSELLVKVSSKDIEKAYLEIPDDEEEQACPQPEPEEEQQQEEESADFNDMSLEEQLEDMAGWSKEDLLEFAKAGDLKDDKDKLIHKFYVRSKPAALLEAVQQSWATVSGNGEEGEVADDGDDIPSDEAGDGCPSGHAFGADFNEKDECKDCADKFYIACMEASQ